MEHLNHSSEKKERIVGYIKEFRRLTEQLVAREDFEPTATVELDGYEGPHTYLNRKLAEEGIRFTEISPFDEFLARSISQEENIKEAGKDQLYHALIGSTRRPYHDIDTSKLYEDVSQRKQMLDVLDDEKTAEELVKVGERTEKINQVKDLILDYRKEISSGKNISDVQNDFFSKFSEMGINITPMFGSFAKFIDQVVFGGQKIYNASRISGNNISVEHKNIIEELKEDPLYHLIVGSTPEGHQIHKKIFNDEKLAQGIVDYL